MTNPYSHPRRRLPGAMLPFVLFLFLTTALLSPAAADSRAWVQVFHSADASELTALANSERAGLSGYGSMSWGQLDAASIEALQAAGARLTISDNPFLLDLGEQRFDPREIESQLTATDPRGGWHLLQFEGPVRSEWLNQLSAAGLTVAQPLHPFSYFVWGTAAQIEAARAMPELRFVGPMQAEWKLLPHLRDFGREIRPTMALASRHADQGLLRSQMAALGEVHAITPLNAHFSIVHMDLAGDRYADLAALPAIYTVQYIAPEAGPRGEMSNQSIVGNYNASGVVFPGYLDWLTDTGFTGDGVIVGVVDGGIRTTHLDLVGRISPCVSGGGSPSSCTTANDSHGTHVAGAIAGTGASGSTNAAGFLRGQGVAPGALVVQQRYPAFLGAGPGGMIPNGMLSIFRESALSNALLTNNSWGPRGTPQGYDIPTQQIDFISRDADPNTPGHQPVLAVWSIMNGDGDSGGACAPSSLGSPDEAKNLFAVGSTALQNTNGSQVGNIFNVSANSGHGPACDGRRVPHIVAPGCRTDSTSSGSNTDFGLSCGTSMASPVVSGAIAVWAEHYIAETGEWPSPALMKAVFTAAAQDLVGNNNANGIQMGHRPDRFQGYGRLDLDLVMNHGVEVFLFDQEEVFTAAGQDWSIGLNAVDPDQPIRIMLTWTDAPGHGMGGTTPAWVNDLDLVVEAGGETYLGNVIGSDGWSASGGSRDERNNLEGVFLSPDQHGGAVNVTVAAAIIAGDALNPWDPGSPSQDFALACYNCIIGDPTFSVSLASTSAAYCVPDSGDLDQTMNVNVSRVGNYDGSVDLSSSGEPAGLSSSFVPETVVVPGSSVWTLTINDSASAGDYLINVSGDDGVNQVTRGFNLRLEEPLLDQPVPTAPANGSSDLSLTPSLSWAGLTDVASHRLQLATDPDFDDLLVNLSVEGNSYTIPSDLPTGTEFFWRVQGENLCGGGVWSEVFSFTTRLEPEAVFSAEQLDFSLPANGSADQILTISNIGTGNLNWSIETDDPSSSVRGGHVPDLDEALAVSNFNLPAQGTVNASAPGGVATRGTVIGFSFEGTVSGISGNGTWASDMVLTITAPDGTDYSVGGFNTSNPPWQFQGSGSNNDGTYTSSHIGEVFGAEGVSDQGEWQFSFEHTWNDPMDWSDVTITLHKLPPPFCGDELTDVPWLSVSPSSGVIAAGDSDEVTVSIDASGLDQGEYLGYLCVSTNDPAAERIAIPVNLDIDGNGPTGPVAVIDDSPLLLSALVGASAEGVLAIGNAGDASLDWSVFADQAPTLAYPRLGRLPGLDDQPVGAPRGQEQLATGPAARRVDGVVFGGPIGGDWDEGFEDVGSLPGSGWSQINNSAPLGSSGWFQGDAGVAFGAHQGSPNSFIAANFNNASGTGTISNWLLTPEMLLENGTVIRFWTRAGAAPGNPTAPSSFPDRLEVRLSTAGDSDDVGSGALDVGEFTTLLLTINENLDVGGYPIEWTEFEIEIEGLAEATSGRVALRYFVTNAGPTGSNGNYIGIDTFSVEQPDLGPPAPCTAPATLPWLTIDPESGSVPVGDELDLVTLTANADGLKAGLYGALVCVETNDPQQPITEVPLLFSVIEQDALFGDRFEEVPED